MSFGVAYCLFHFHLMADGSCLGPVMNLFGMLILVRWFLDHSGSVLSDTFSSDGTWIVSGSSDKSIHIWDAETGEVVSGPFEGHTNGSEAVHIVWLYLVVSVDSMFGFVSDHHLITSELLLPAFRTTELSWCLQTAPLQHG